MIMSARSARGPNEHEKIAPLEWRAPSKDAEPGISSRPW
jgi:hypothetical protein